MSHGKFFGRHSSPAPRHWRKQAPTAAETQEPKPKQPKTPKTPKQQPTAAEILKQERYQAFLRFKKLQKEREQNQ